MGGYGSGIKTNVECTDSYRSIDIRRWQNQKVLVPGISFKYTWLCNDQEKGRIRVKTEEGMVILSYSTRLEGGEWVSFNYSVNLQTTACHYGGERYWFICPAIGCGRRVALLYMADKYFACRHCYQLAYPSQRETTDNRAIRRANKIRDKLDWEPGILNARGRKPKGMHWKKFWRLEAEYDAIVRQAFKRFLRN